MLLVTDDFYTPSRPSRCLNPNFGMALSFDDFMPPSMMDVRMFPMCRNKKYCKPQQSVVSTKDSDLGVTPNKENFRINLDVQQFKPNEITVKVVGKNTITIEGKHEEKQDEHGSIYRHFFRKCCLPEGYDINGVVSHLSSDGVLSISAPPAEKLGESVRNLEIQQTEEPSKLIESSKEIEEEKRT